MFLLNLAQCIMHCEVERMETNAYLGPLLCLFEVDKDVVGRHLTSTDVVGRDLTSTDVVGRHLTSTDVVGRDLTLTDVVKSGESLSNVGPVLRLSVEIRSPGG
jgi:hypothetical protein